MTLVVCCAKINVRMRVTCLVGREVRRTGYNTLVILQRFGSHDPLLILFFHCSPFLYTRLMVNKKCSGVH